MQLNGKITVIVGLVVGIIILGAMLPAALTSMYGMKSAKVSHIYAYDENGRPIATDLNLTQDSATSAVLQLQPLFVVLGGMMVLAGAGLKYTGYI